MRQSAAVQQSGSCLRIAIVDESGLRAAVLEEGLREAGYEDIVRIPPHGAFVAELERLAPDVVLIDLGRPSRDTLEEMLDGQPRARPPDRDVRRPVATMR